MTLNCKIALVLWKIILFVMAGFFCSIFDNIFLLGKLYQQFRQNPKQKDFSFNVDFFTQIVTKHMWELKNISARKEIISHCI